MEFDYFSGSVSIFGGLLWLLAPFVLSMYEFSQTVNYGIVLLLTPFVLILGLIGFYREYADSYSLAGRFGIFSFGTGILLFVPVATHRTVYEYALPTGAILITLAIIGALIAEAGTIGIAIDAIQTGIPSKNLGLWLPLALPITGVSNYLADTTINTFHLGLHYYTGVFGLAWIGIGYLTIYPDTE